MSGAGVVVGVGVGVGVVVGVGASRGVSAGEVLDLVADALAAVGLTTSAVAQLATVEAKSAEPGIVAAAERLGVPLVAYRARVLAEVLVPGPSDAALAAVGTPSVAEAAALAAVRGGRLLVAKRKSAPAGRPSMATVAVAGPAAETIRGGDPRPGRAGGDLGR